MRNKKSAQSHNENGNNKGFTNKGFTLVELIVVLVIMAIMLGLAAMGIFGWQDWSKMKQEQANAETIFLAAQNQLNEYAASGSLEKEVQSMISTSGDTYTVTEIVETAKTGNEEMEVLLGRIKSPEGTNYDWDELWSTSYGARVTDKSKYQGRIVSLRSRPEDYEKYLNQDPSLGDEQKLLFKLITSYIYDKSILNNAAIMIEFSPDAAQVFAVCYSDRVDSFKYGDTSGSDVSVMDRRETVLSDNFVGYYGVDTLAKAIKGKNKTRYDVAPGHFELRNEEVFYAAFCPEDQEEVFSGSSNIDYVINVYNPDIEETDRDAQKVMSLKFNIAGTDLPPVGIKGAQRENAMTAEATYYADGEPIQVPADEGVGTKNMTASFRVPVWMEWTSKGERVICFALDAADIQAQSVTYAEALLGSSFNGAAYAAEAFSQTYSFYRFGLNVDRVYLGMELYERIEAENETEGATSKQLMEEVISAKSDKPGVENPEGEYVTFNKVERGTNKTTYEISNGRHLYNIRFVEDYADKIPEVPTTIGQLAHNTDWHKKSMHEFVIKKNIDWKKFTARDMSDGVARENYFLDSYNKMGIKVEEDTVEIYAGIGLAGIDTQKAEFPSFRQLYGGNIFTQAVSYEDANDENGASYVISNLVLSTDANELYGLYGYETQQKNIASMDSSQSEDARKEKYDELALDRAKGIRPTGLFNINYGTISNITLDSHKVFGAYKVGGFTGENLGVLDKLLLKNEKNDSGKLDEVDEYMVGKLTSANKLIIPYFYGSNLNGSVRYYAIKYNNDDKKALREYLTDTLYGRNTSFIVGVQDVGGIVGYQKSMVTLSNSDAPKVTYNKLTNEAWVSGQAYLGGIIGRSIVIGGTETVKSDRYEEVSIPNNAMAYTTTGTTSLNLKPLKFADFNSDENYGRIQALPIYDRTGITSIDYSAPNTNGAYYIGGIAGMTSQNIETFSGDDGISLISCRSCSLYTDEELEEMGLTSGISDDSAVFDETRGMFCGGLVGYARYTRFTDCATDVPEERQKEDEHPYVFGWSFVGGFAGAAEGCVFETESGDKTINETNVVGKVLVGGIAGLLGRPSVYGKTNWKDIVELYQLDPQETDIATPADAADLPHTIQAKNIVNKGLTFAFGDNEGTTIGTNKGANKNMAWCGGICGYNAEQMENCDSLLSEYAKKQMLAIRSNIDGKIDYLGDRVGGLAGENNWVINGVSGNESRVNTIVIGENCVGGAVGYVDGKITDENDNIERSVKNVILKDGENGVSIAGEEIDDFKGSYIQGYDKYTGGIAGYEGLGAVFNDSVEITDSFIVHGKDYVGGFIGGVMGKANSFDTQFAGTLKAGQDKLQSVRGDGFYTGGFVGAVAMQSRKQKYFADLGKRVSVSGVSEVKGTYFTGGFGGAAILPRFTDQEHAVDISEYTVQNDKMSVSGRAFSGGYYGYYEVTESPTQEEYFIKLQNASEYHFGDDGEVASDVESTYSSMGITEKNYNNNYNSVPGRSYVNDVVNNMDIDLSDSKSDYVRVGSVTAGLYAGGLFGFVPRTQSLRISYNNKAAVEATDVMGLDVDKNSLCGGIIGKAGNNMVLDGCSNEGHIKSISDYFGSLTEVNNGVIINCTVKNAFPAADANSPGYDSGHEYKYVGGLCGYNQGTISGNIKVEGDSEYQVEGAYYTGGLVGENQGTILLSPEYRYPISVRSTKGAAGGICGISTFGSISCAYSVVTGGTEEEMALQKGLKSANPENKTTISAATYAGIIAGENKSDICGITFDNSEQTWIRIPADLNLQIKGDIATGAIAGLNNKETICYCENDLDITVPSGALGGIAGASQGGEIEDCINVGNLVSTEGVSGGIAGMTGEAAKINECANFGSADYSITRGDDTVTISCCIEAGGKTGDAFFANAGQAQLNYYISGVARYATEGEDPASTEDVIIDEAEEYYEQDVAVSVPVRLAVETQVGDDGDKFALHALIEQDGGYVPKRINATSISGVNPLFISESTNITDKVGAARKLYIAIYNPDINNVLF